MSKRPLIGIAPGFDYKENKIFLNKGYPEAITKCHGMPFIIPITDHTDTLDDIIERCDGFILSGGPDVDALHFGEINLACNGEISPYRDTMELYIAKKVIALNKPILGICRGMQVMNIALGGSIYQDIFTQAKKDDLIKHSQSAPVWYPTHFVNIEESSKLYPMFTGRLRVNSFHHQAVKDTADGFKVTATSEDGIIECIEHIHNDFAVGVQWHPETMWKEDDIHLELFKELVGRGRFNICPKFGENEYLV